ncbi:hypothetical protein TSOC_005537 [Tetrabaena socialis]|uniref:Uncharacterized protein n=1 Tax=Tetrabaena socialis TaxID=47790 RepID=A0A2J8A622_9CHLO|nr:hypothetical protein TSOC_005537 [Tetrabaena socialis]|eukprot:PNH07950.1 hypothetical protein TSOC_005537 [Tetrabaena socialis]
MWPWGLLLLLGLVCGAQGVRLACEDSGMCSVGQVQPYSDDIRPSPALKACLAARSYRREVILLTETRLNPVYQTFRTLLSLGYEHVVLLSLPDRCARSTALWPRLGCVWSSQRLASNTKYLLDRQAALIRMEGADAGANISERFGYLPHYLAESWSHGGALGYWNPALARTTGHAPVVLAHFVHVPGGATNKLTVKMASNNWDWDVAHAAHPNRGVFFASSLAVPLPDVLGYSQAVLDRDWATEQEFASAAMALLRVAMETGRAVSWPAPRCNVSWLGGADNNQLPLRVPQSNVIPYAPADKGIADLRCLWAGYLLYGCQAGRWHFAGGLLAPEYDHLLQLLRRNGSAVDAAGAANLDALGLRQPTTDAVGDATTTHPSVIDGSSNEVAEVAPELLRPPASAAAWDVAALGTALMARHGGPGAGMQVLLQPGSAAALTVGVPVEVAAAVPGAIAAAQASSAAVAAAAAAAGGGGAGALRPRVLLLPEVPLLTERLGQRHELFKAMVSGPDRSTQSCDWVATGRPYRRARTRRRRRRAAR